MLKKIVSIIALVVLVVTAASMAFAGGGSISGVPACNAGAVTMNVKLSFVNGTVRGNGNACVFTEGCTASVKAVLHKKQGGKWVRVSSVTQTKSATATCSAVKGTTYRVTVSCEVKDANGKVVDSLPEITSTKTY